LKYPEVVEEVEEVLVVAEETIGEEEILGVEGEALVAVEEVEVIIEGVAAEEEEEETSEEGVVVEVVRHPEAVVIMKEKGHHMVVVIDTRAEGHHPPHPLTAVEREITIEMTEETLLLQEMDLQEVHPQEMDHQEVLPQGMDHQEDHRLPRGTVMGLLEGILVDLLLLVPQEGHMMEEDPAVVEIDTRIIIQVEHHLHQLGLRDIGVEVQLQGIIPLHTQVDHVQEKDIPQIQAIHQVQVEVRDHLGITEVVEEQAMVAIKITKEMIEDTVVGVMKDPQDHLHEIAILRLEVKEEDMTIAEIEEDHQDIIVKSKPVKKSLSFLHHGALITISKHNVLI